MKKRNLIFICLAAGLLLISIPNKTQAFGWDYKSEESIDKMEGKTYLRTDCEDKPGDDCTMPGSSTRMDISDIVDLIKIIRIRL